MRVTIVGCAGSFPGPHSPASCYLVQAEHEGRDFSLVLDLGNGALGALQRHIDLEDIGAVAISHLHPDHVVDVLGLYVARKYRPSGPYEHHLPLFGPTSTERRLSLMYHGIEPAGLASQFEFHVIKDAAPFTAGPFTVTPLRVNHPVEAYGFRVEAGGKVLAYSGDTDASPVLSTLFTEADLVLCDSAWVDGRDNTPGIHLSGSGAARAAIAAGGVKRLMLTHIPAWNDPEVCRAQAAAVWAGDVELAEPDKTYDL